jgi:hypothetical protein
VLKTHNDDIGIHSSREEISGNNSSSNRSSSSRSTNNAATANMMTQQKGKRTEIKSQTLVSSMRIGLDELKRIETRGKGIAPCQAFLVAAINVRRGKATCTDGAKSHARTKRIQRHATSKNFVRGATAVYAQRRLRFWIPTATNLAAIFTIRIGHNGGPLMLLLMLLLLMLMLRHDGNKQWRPVTGCCFVLQSSHKKTRKKDFIFLDRYNSNISNSNQTQKVFDGRRVRTHDR